MCFLGVFFSVRFQCVYNIFAKSIYRIISGKNNIYLLLQEKAHKAMDYLWNQRHRSSDLVGTVINIHNGDWIRRGQLRYIQVTLLRSLDIETHLILRPT